MSAHVVTLVCVGCAATFQGDYRYEAVCDTCKQGVRVGSWTVEKVLPYVAPRGAMWAASSEKYETDTGPRCLSAPTLAQVLEDIREYEQQQTELDAIADGRTYRGRSAAELVRTHLARHGRSS